MKKGKILWVMLSVLTVVSLLFTACFPETTPTPTKATFTPTASATLTPTPETHWWDELGEPEYGGEITVSTRSQVDNFDPYNYFPGNTLFWLECFWAPSWTVDRSEMPWNTGVYLPEYMEGWLAESWEWTEPDLMTVKIKEGIHWQNKEPVNGREFTAYDIQYHYDRVLGIGSGFDTPALYASSYLQLIERVTATDKYTVTIEFKDPTMIAVLQVMENFHPNLIEARESVEAERGLDDWHNAVGTGCWILTDFVQGSKKTLSRNPDYWGYDERHPENQVPYVDELNEILIQDRETTLAAVRSGRLDMAIGLTFTQAQVMEKTNPEILYAQQPYNGVAVNLRVDVEPFGDIRVRKAMQMAINLEDIAVGYYQNTVDSTPVGLLARETGLAYLYEDWPQSLKDEYSYNPDRARDLLAEAGYPDGFDTSCIASTMDDLTMLEILQSYFSDIGIEMEIIPMEKPAHHALAAGHGNFETNYGFCSLVWGLTQTSILNASTNTVNNFSNVNDPYCDELSYKAIHATTNEELKEALIAIDKYDIEQHFSVKTLPGTEYTAYQPYLKGYSGEKLGQAIWTFYARLWIDSELKSSMGR